jgi:hypothetical protein
MGGDERLLHDVLRSQMVAGHRLHEAVNGPMVPLEQHAKGLVVSLARSRHQRVVVRLHSVVSPGGEKKVSSGGWEARPIDDPDRESQ